MARGLEVSNDGEELCFSLHFCLFLLPFLVPADNVPVDRLVNPLECLRTSSKGITAEDLSDIVFFYFTLEGSDSFFFKWYTLRLEEECSHALLGNSFEISLGNFGRNILAFLHFLVGN